MTLWDAAATDNIKMLHADNNRRHTERRDWTPSIGIKRVMIQAREDVYRHTLKLLSS
jgi:hypothetical protein